MTGPQTTEWLQAGCKLNLFLHINGRRNDGYHELQTYFQLLDYGDELRIETGDNSGVIHVEWIAGDEDLRGRPTQPEDDLLYRAAQLLRDEAQHRGFCLSDTVCSARITLRKHVPVGGGLGGGSAAAAQVLLELNRQWQLGFSVDELAALGKLLGADVPVFLYGKSAMAHGIGEKLLPGPLADVPPAFLILVPDRIISTASLFASPNLERDAEKQPDQLLRERWQEDSFNAFESVVLADDPALRALHQDLSALAGFARLTGAGACLFAPVDSPERGVRIGKKLSEGHPVLRRFIVAGAKRI
ncbi:MAG TPA: 4-(cytidine 5'-diphospho)-2-C-methyl-D-erythritol kinase [Guyparkeria sp.]|nr:4-(cytidine 5'-diphospho)-2-C-methyl-D-erythritol kinase [Guyparkeria sp.]